MYKILLFILLLFSFSLNAKNILSKISPGEKLPADQFIKLYKIINPTVVNIAGKQQGSLYTYPSILPFNLPYNNIPHRSEPPSSLGTGFIISSKGLIITNAHVIANANIITVKVAKDNKEYIAKIIGQDKSSDIALIKINTKYQLPFASLGSSQALQVGQWVAAFGNPYGYSHTMTKGIISAKGREIDELNRFPFLQTDASINKGNSGGPLVNMQGEVIGVNSAIDPRAQGIGFAIPIDNVKSILKELKEYGFVKRGFLGIYMLDLTPSLSRTVGAHKKNGALIVEVLRNSPAEKGGLRTYDIVTKFNNKPILSSRDLSKAIKNSASDAQILLTIYRKNKVLQLKIKLRPHSQNLHKRPLSKKVSSKKAKVYFYKAPYKLGFHLVNANKKSAKYLQLPYLAKLNKPVVVEISKHSSAHLSGLAYLDIILDVNLKKIKTAKQAFRALKKGTNYIRILRNKQVYLLQMRGR
ncbi:MAG: PDZ domain-containing protein [Bdellovibrionaceae bacterium]|nr:PDZ domain-containing protein [Pseudobdellovibrionaceae bacterium]